MKAGIRNWKSSEVRGQEGKVLKGNHTKMDTVVEV
jgi:hypothetical protein